MRICPPISVYLGSSSSCLSNDTHLLHYKYKIKLKIKELTSKAGIAYLIVTPFILLQLHPVLIHFCHCPKYWYTNYGYDLILLRIMLSLFADRHKNLYSVVYFVFFEQITIRKKKKKWMLCIYNNENVAISTIRQRLFWWDHTAFKLETRPLLFWYSNLFSFIDIWKKFHFWKNLFLQLI